jgi:uracil-DNA glycosylase
MKNQMHMPSLSEEYQQLSQTWRDALSASIGDEHIESLNHFVAHAREHSQVFPEAGEVFTALRLCPLDQTRVVILGQDPYHGPGQAHGLSFSVRDEMKLPPSLRNMFKELDSDLGIPPAKRGDLTAWAAQGVLMLNAVLTVRASEANSHQKQGWERFTDAVINAVNEHCEHVVFVLWGRPAQKKEEVTRRVSYLY